MKRKIIFALSALICAAAAAEAPDVYISPNNDGIQDALVVPLKITDRRYVSEWSFIVEDAAGNVVRRIGNKVALPANPTFADFWDELRSEKHGVDVPESVTWNGITNNGSVAPDGVYYYYVTASDDNGNTSRSAKYKVTVDNTPPEITFAPLSDADKTFGSGSRTVLRIIQSGSREELWTARIRDAAGNEVRSFEWKNRAPGNVDWNGLDSARRIVGDGVYSYEISSVDRAGNSTTARVSNIVFSLEKPEIAVFISGSHYFAPDPQGDVWQSRRTMEFLLAIPTSASGVNSLTDWELSVVRERAAEGDDAAVFTRRGRTNPPSTFTFDGRDDGGAALPDGEYRLRVRARYLNGYEHAPVYSPVFVVDNSAPRAEVTLPSHTVFNGERGFELAQRAESEAAYTGRKSWTGRITDESSRVIRTYNFGDALPEKVSWDGLDGDGIRAPDGRYRYELYVTELAGNCATVRSGAFTLDTSDTELALSASAGAFSPNADSVKDTINLIPIAHAASGIASYELTISSEEGAVRTFRGEGEVPAAFVWDGTSDAGDVCPDGVYRAAIRTAAESGSTAAAVCAPFVIDTVAPSISADAVYKLFSPDGGSSREEIPVEVLACSQESRWGAQVRNSSSDIVRTFSWDGRAENFSWDGTDDSGNTEPDGVYTIVIFSTDEAGNSANALIDGIVLDTRPVAAYIVAAYTGISPNGDGFLEEQSFNLQASPADGISSWTLDIIGGEDGATRVKTLRGEGDLPAVVTWAGDSDEGAAEGMFYARLAVNYEKGNAAEALSTPFICTATPPVLSCVTEPGFFSPDNDGVDDDLFITLGCQTIANLTDWEFTVKDRNGLPFWRTSGKSSIANRIVWDGRGAGGEFVQSAEDYTCEFTARDDLGMQSTIEGLIRVDVLVIRDGDKLKMQIPSIVFRSNEADFGVQEVDSAGHITRPGITQAQADNDRRVLSRVADILKKFRSYSVLISGHANRVSDNEAEETEEGIWGKALIPLSEQRAEYVKSELVKLGISASRLSVEGKGGTEPIADRKDSNENWKNRRVEFILEK